MKHEVNTRSHGNVAALSRVRSFVTFLVVLYHAAGNYVYFGNGDHKRWIGFDFVVLFADSFFMPLIFFVSGLFVFSGLTHKGAALYIFDRLWRLGMPFLISIFVLVQIAYYPTFLIYHWPGTTDFNFFHFWQRTLTVGPWPSGPAWFLWVLIAFDFLAITVWFTARTPLTTLGRWIGDNQSSIRAYAAIVAITLTAYVPFALLFGRDQWFAAGPISIQASRIVLYAVYFLLGVAVGVTSLTSGLLAQRGPVARSWLIWIVIAALAFAVLAALSYGESKGFALRMNMSVRAVEDAIVFSLFCASMGFACLGIALHFADRDWAVWRFLDAMTPVAYGIFLTHYMFILWLQYAVFSSQMPAIAKFAIVFCGALAGGWIVTRLLRSIPFIARMI